MRSKVLSLLGMKIINTDIAYAIVDICMVGEC